jgi:hypothetical protein
MAARKSSLWFLFLAANAILLLAFLVHGGLRNAADEPVLREKQDMVKRLGLSDLCLFTDARYSRHPSMADFNTPFQDYPLSLEHFPSGSILSPPPQLARPR